MKTLELTTRAHADQAIQWRDERLVLLDQRVLPLQVSYIGCDDALETAAAIRAMVVRGAPAIGITAAYGVVLGARQHYQRAGGRWRESLAADLRVLGEARPTAINLHWALQRMQGHIDNLGEGDPTPALLAEAQRIHAEDHAANRRMGDFGAGLLEAASVVITHCNAGALATGGRGTALGVIRSAWEQGKLSRVFADETRPWLQGARLTAWELAADGIPVTLMAEGAAAARMQRGDVGWVIVGSDRIAANGDVANKIGTYSLAVLARQHGVRMMVAAPTSTIDLAVPDGRAIPIEERDPAELLACAGQAIAPAQVAAWNPVFDVTPAGLVDALVTERGVVLSPNAEKLAAHMA